MEPNRWLLALTAGMVLPLAGHGEPATRRDLEQLKQDIQALKALKDQYEARLSALEAQLKATEANNAALSQQVQQTKQTAQAASQQATAAKEESRSIRALPSLTNPQLSLVLSGTYANLSHREPRTINGFWAPNGELMGHERGFSLLGSEATATARIDPYFAGTFTAHFHEEDVDVEEAFVDTTALPAGTGIRFGRFFSALGYLNDKHAHAWNFIDEPLPYRAFLDGANFGGDGVRASWVPPTPWMTELSFEAFQGDRFPAERTGNKPGTMVGAAHVGSDLSPTVSWRAGVSGVFTKAKGRELATGEETGEPEGHAHQLAPPDPLTEARESFWGDNRLVILDGILKWQPRGSGQAPDLNLAGEYFFGHEKGEYRFGLMPVPVSDDAQGWYLEATGRVFGRWRSGVRYDTVLRDNSPLFEALDEKRRRSWQASSMVEFLPSEFSRLRFQYGRHQLTGKETNAFWLQYIMSLGAHGAHGF